MREYIKMLLIASLSPIFVMMATAQSEENNYSI